MLKKVGKALIAKIGWIVHHGKDYGDNQKEDEETFF